MVKKPIVISLFSLLLFIALTYYFISFTVELNTQTLKLDDLLDLLEEVSHDKVLLLITSLITLLTIFSTLIQYLISKFLLIIFSNKVKVRIYYALLPKSLILVLNILFMGLFGITNSWLYVFTAFVGSIFIYLFFQYKKENWKAALIFSSVFLLDSIVSIGKEIF